MNWNSDNSAILRNLTYLSILIYGGFYILYIGQQFIIPFLLALFLTWFIIGIAKFYNSHVKNIVVSYFLSVCSIFVVLYFVGQIFSSNYIQLLELAPQYQEKIVSSIWALTWKYKILDKLNFGTIIEYINFPTLVAFFGNIITSFIANASVVLLYTVFLLMEYRFFKEKMVMLVSKSYHKEEIIQTIHQIREDISSYFIYKSMISLSIAIVSYIVMLLVWLDFALFWAFVIFILDFIPNIGSLIAMIFPIIFWFIQFNTLTPAIINSVGIIAAQMIISNVVEPKVMWNRLNLSALVIMLSLWFWWIIWGGIWMILAMPVMVSLNIIFSKFEATKWIAILMSEKGEIKTDFTFDIWKKSHKKLLFEKIKEKVKKKKS